MMLADRVILGVAVPAGAVGHQLAWRQVCGWFDEHSNFGFFVRTSAVWWLAIDPSILTRSKVAISWISDLSASCSSRESAGRTHSLRARQLLTYQRSGNGADAG
jgi:hypothetical protein